jgi:CRISPR system Cascade subunit CasB
MHTKDTRVRAILRRSLAFEPSRYIPAYPYVEPFVVDAEGWRREAHYLVAGLWATHLSEGRAGQVIKLGEACAMYQKSSGSESVERRFINLLDADLDQLPHRLRQMVALLKEQPLDFEYMLKGLLRWNSENRYTQNNWARDYYRNLSDKKTEEINA